MSESIIQPYTPFCVILTHRHGACVGIVLQSSLSFLKSDFKETVRSYVAQKSNNLKLNNNFEFFYEENNFIFARVLGKTAENLSNLFQFACHTLNINANSLKSFVVGTGPGSFTGLRLGCAFVNGIHLASPETKLFLLSTLLVNEFSAELRNESTLVEAFIDELKTYNPNDPSSGYVTFFDLFHAMHQISKNNLTACSTLIPNYAKEPTPVLNLRKE